MSSESLPPACPRSATFFIIEDDPIMAQCLKTTCESAAVSAQVFIFQNAIAAITALNHHLPDLIILEILLNGPDGFTFLNELLSYGDTAAVPVLVVTSLKLPTSDLSHYNIHQVLQKDRMTPSELKLAIRRSLPSHLTRSLSPGVSHAP